MGEVYSICGFVFCYSFNPRRWRFGRYHIRGFDGVSEGYWLMFGPVAVWKTATK